MSASTKRQRLFSLRMILLRFLGKVRGINRRYLFAGSVDYWRPAFASLFPELVNIAGNKENQDEKGEHIGKDNRAKSGGNLPGPPPYRLPE